MLRGLRITHTDVLDCKSIVQVIFGPILQRSNAASGVITALLDRGH